MEMAEWYYAHDGQQKGPVPLSELRRLATSGEFDPREDLVWKDGMEEWKPASEVPEFASLGAGAAAVPESPPPVASAPPSGELNPYAVQGSGLAPMEQAPAPEGELQEIVPGSSPIDIGSCISRGFELTKRHFGVIFATGAVYVGIVFGYEFFSGIVQGLMEGSTVTTTHHPGGYTTTTSSGSPAALAVTLVLELVGQAISIFVGLGVTRIGLNLVSGRPAAVAMIFGEGSKFWRAVGAGILYGLMVGVGLILLIVPGIYLALRYGQYHSAIVDKDMGIMESLNYSAAITENNKMPLLGLAILSFLIVLAGALVLLVGLIFAYPIVWLAGLVAYQWMKYGPVAVRDRA